VGWYLRVGFPRRPDPIPRNRTWRPLLPPCPPIATAERAQTTATSSTLRQRQRPQQLVVGSTTSVWGGDRQLERPVVAAVNHDCVNPCNFAPWNVFLVRHCPPGITSWGNCSPEGSTTDANILQEASQFQILCFWGTPPPVSFCLHMMWLLSWLPHTASTAMRTAFTRVLLWNSSVYSWRVQLWYECVAYHRLLNSSRLAVSSGWTPS